MKKTVTILGIETSCDETAVALVRAEKTGNDFRFTVEENFVSSQIPTHRKHGGVVPEIAAREHAIRLPLLLNQLASTSSQKHVLQKRVDAIAVTAGPGLITCLLVGVEVAKTIASAWKKPLVPTHHLEGHIYANLLLEEGLRTQNAKLKMQNFRFPVLALVVSGAHTELVLMKKHLSYKLLGSTRDDAVGEAFDKAAKLLELPYPGGPSLSRLAQTGNAKAVSFPRSMLNQDNLDFSYSGLKTAVLYELQKKRFSKADVAASFEAAATEILIEKTIRAAKQFKPKTVLLAGGVAANLPLRKNLKIRFAEVYPKITVLEPDLKYTTDNAAMIAAAGGVRFLLNKVPRLSIDPRPPLK